MHSDLDIVESDYKIKEERQIMAPPKYFFCHTKCMVMRPKTMQYGIILV